jgi:hypothetical protein
LLACAAGPSGDVAERGTPEIRLDDDPNSSGFGTLVLSGLTSSNLSTLRQLGDDAWGTRFPVFTDEAADTPDRPPVLGTYAIEDGLVRFTPEYPLIPGRTYVARWTNGDETIEVRVALPQTIGNPTTVVAAVYPTVDEVPENLLKLYVQFSAPMSRGEAERRIRLLDDAGEMVPLPWVAPEHELWNRQTDRLTLFFDPGRIKQGVGPNREYGPPLEAGRSYRLVIDADWSDASGQPLAAPFEKTLRVRAPDRESPDHEAWRLSPPTSASGEVTLDFGEPLDRALVERFISVLDDAGGRVPGHFRIERGERAWSFSAGDGWTAKPYVVVVDNGLTDLAGNSLRRRFDASMDTPRGVSSSVHIPFKVAPSD